MKIRYTAASPKAGIEEHLNNQTAATLIAAGFAVHVPYKNFVEFMNAEHREGRDPNNSNPPQVVGVVWECSANARSGVPTIYRRQGGEVARMTDEAQAIQYGVPDSVLKTYRELTANGDAEAIALAAAKQEQIQRESADKTSQRIALWKNA